MGHVACVGKKGNAHCFGKKTLRKERPFGIRRHHWGVILKCMLQKQDGGGLDWINLAQDREKWHVVANMVMNF